ncbi:MAG: DUF6494 family protein [Gammaproteobacteria bacterium]|nr:hypothetical protein [Gammaproteobacteria bacterium]
MDQETFNLSIRRFLKKVGISSQREIEHAVEKALENGTLQGNETFQAKMRLEVPDLEIEMEFEGEITLEQPR